MRYVILALVAIMWAALASCGGESPDRVVAITRKCEWYQDGRPVAFESEACTTTRQLANQRLELKVRSGKEFYTVDVPLETKVSIGDEWPLSSPWNATAESLARK